MATNTGVYYRDATMSAWQPFDEDLPNVTVTDLEISYQNGGKIRASTYGRGLWESNLYDNAPCNIPPTPIISSFKGGCADSQLSLPSIKGDNLKYYAEASGGMAIAAPTSNNAPAKFYVSQTVNACESMRVEVKLLLEKSKSPTLNTSTTSYCVGAVAAPLTATGNNLKWYTSETGGQAQTSITPPTNAATTLAYFVSQTETDKCESGRAKVEVTVKPKPTGILSGSKTIFQYDSTQIQVNLTGDAPWSIVLDNQIKLQAQNTPANFFVKPLQTTTYRLVSVENTCGLGTVSGEAVITVTPVLSVTPNQDAEMQVFPNPTVGDLTIKAKTVQNSSYDIELTDATGRVLVKQTNAWLNNGNEVKLSTGQLAQGTYLLRAVNKQKSYTWKIVKQ